MAEQQAWYQNGGFKILSVSFGFLLQFAAIIWWASTMGNSIETLKVTSHEISSDVRDVRERLISVETKIHIVDRDLEECRQHIAGERGGGG